MTRCKRQDIVNATNYTENDLSYEATIITRTLQSSSVFLATCHRPYPEPDKYSPRIHTLFL